MSLTGMSNGKYFNDCRYQTENSKRLNDMHNVDIDIVEMSLDVIKFAINRITDTNPVLGYPKSEAELDALIGETITENGIGGETAFALFRDVLIKASIPIDHPRHLAFVPASPTRAARSGSKARD